jgi:hypothetical protein
MGPPWHHEYFNLPLNAKDCKFNCKFVTLKKKKKKRRRTIVVILIEDHEKKILVTANDFGSSKTNPGQRPKHHFCCGDMGKKVKYHKRGDLGK